jgi:hypothetical protein
MPVAPAVHSNGMARLAAGARMPRRLLVFHTSRNDLRIPRGQWAGLFRRSSNRHSSGGVTGAPCEALMPPAMSEDEQTNTQITRLPREFVDRLTRPFARFSRIEAAGGGVLLLFAVAALVLSKSPWAHAFFDVWETRIGPCSAMHFRSLVGHGAATRRPRRSTQAGSLKL